MDVDISPELLQACKNAFQKDVESSAFIKKFIKNIRDGTATVKDLSQYSEQIGKILGRSLMHQLTDEVLPNQTLYYNIAKAVIEPMLKDNFSLVDAAADEVFSAIYNDLEVGVKVAKPTSNQDRVNGILDHVTEEGITPEQRAQRLYADAQNVTQTYCDETIRVNAKRANDVGLESTVVRSLGGGGCCKWCKSLVGTYRYEEVNDTGNDVWRRHENCNCVIDVTIQKPTSIYRKTYYGKRKR